VNRFRKASLRRRGEWFKCAERDSSVDTEAPLELEGIFACAGALREFFDCGFTGLLLTHQSAELCR
jgi:hypothetical protein